MAPYVIGVNQHVCDFGFTSARPFASSIRDDWLGLGTRLTYVAFRGSSAPRTIYSSLSMSCRSYVVYSWLYHFLFLVWSFPKCSLPSDSALLLALSARLRQSGDGLIRSTLISRVIEVVEVRRVKSEPHS